MSTKRDFLSDLKDFAKRPAFSAQNTGADWARLREIIKAHRAMDTLNPDSLLRRELSKHLVVSMTAVVQAQVRRIISETVDQRDKRGERIPDLSALNIQLTTELAREIKGQSFSVGQFVARFLGFSTIPQIDDSLQWVCGKRLKDVVKAGLKTVAPDGTAQAELDQRLSRIMRRLGDIFGHSQTLCREEATELKIEPGDLDSFIEDFIIAVPAICAFRYSETSKAA